MMLSARGTDHHQAEASLGPHAYTRWWWRTHACRHHHACACACTRTHARTRIGITASAQVDMACKEEQFQEKRRMELMRKGSLGACEARFAEEAAKKVGGLVGPCMPRTLALPGRMMPAACAHAGAVVFRQQSAGAAVHAHAMIALPNAPYSPPPFSSPSPNPHSVCAQKDPLEQVGLVLGRVGRRSLGIRARAAWWCAACTPTRACTRAPQRAHTHPGPPATHARTHPTAPCAVLPVATTTTMPRPPLCSSASTTPTPTSAACTKRKPPPTPRRAVAGSP
jgi:hypothetical protein